MTSQGEGDMHVKLVNARALESIFGLSAYQDLVLFTVLEGALDSPDLWSLPQILSESQCLHQGFCSEHLRQPPSSPSGSV